jgi:hypothetical protein
MGEFCLEHELPPAGSGFPDDSVPAPDLVELPLDPVPA